MTQPTPQSSTPISDSSHSAPSRTSNHPSAVSASPVPCLICESSDRWRRCLQPLVEPDGALHRKIALRTVQPGEVRRIVSKRRPWIVVWELPFTNADAPTQAADDSFLLIRRVASLPHHVLQIVAAHRDDSHWFSTRQTPRLALRQLGADLVLDAPEQLRLAVAMIHRYVRGGSELQVPAPTA